MESWVSQYFSTRSIIGVSTRVEISTIAMMMNKEPLFNFNQVDNIKLLRKKNQPIHTFFTYTTDLPNGDSIYLLSNISVPRFRSNVQPSASVHLFAERPRLLPIRLIDQFCEIDCWISVPSLFLQEIIEGLGQLTLDPHIQHTLYDITSFDTPDYLIIE